MSFLNNLVNQYTHGGGGGQQQQGQQSYQQSSSYSQQGGYPPRPGGYQDRPYNERPHNDGGRPNPPPPWIAEWDNQRNTWIFINRQTGQRTHEFPRGGGGGYQQGGYQQGGYQQDNYQQSTTYETVNYGGQPQQQRKDHSTRNTALGVAAGLAGGALLMHEGHKVEERWDEDKERFDYDRDRVEDRVDYDRDRFEDRVEYDKYRAEDRVYDGVQDVEDFPDDAARWTGRKVQEVEDIPEDVAGWAGRRVQGVEDFGDDIRDSYDDGRADQEYRDDRRYDDSW